MAGETDLEAMLRTLTVSRRPGRFTLVTLDSKIEPPAIGNGIEAVLEESEGTTIVCTVETAEANNWPQEFLAAWLTLDVHSALEAVGLTAAFSVALAGQGIPCNVLAGYFHDHLLVPEDRAADAVACLEGLAG